MAITNHNNAEYQAARKARNLQAKQAMAEWAKGLDPYQLGLLCQILERFEISSQDWGRILHNSVEDAVG